MSETFNTARDELGRSIRYAARLSTLLAVTPHHPSLLELLRDITPDLNPILPCNSNWQAAYGYRLFVYDHPAARMPLHRGFFEGDGHSVWTDGPQAVTDAATETLWRVHRNHAEAFAGLPFCGVCRRPLTDDTSRALGIGPDCARLLGIPHTRPPARAAKIAHEKACTGAEPMQARQHIITERRAYQ